MQLKIDNKTNSGQPDDKVFVSIIGIDPGTGDTVYYDWATQLFKKYSSYTSGTTSHTVKQIKAKWPNGAPIPAIQSARIYLAAGEDFSSMANSGPGSDSNVLYDKVEFDTHTPGYYNINQTNVDFYGLSYTITVGDVTRGLSQTRSAVIEALSDLPQPVTAGQKYGNPLVFQWTNRLNDKGELVRVFAPKSAAYTDWGATPAEQAAHANRVSHFFDKYVTEKCFPKGRTFTFYNKFGKADANQRWAEVKHEKVVNPQDLKGPMIDGPLKIFVYDNETRTGTPTCTLTIPASSWPNPDMKDPSNYHQDSGDVDQIDWGFILFDNVNGSGAAAEWGINPDAMAIMVSICRGVAHLDNGTTDWMAASKFYQGDGKGNSTEEMPIFYFAKALHGLGGNMVYVLSYDDVYGQNSSIGFDSGATVSIDICGAETLKPTAA